MSGNLWTEHAAELAEAYRRDAGSVRFELVTRALLEHLSDPPRRVVDVGGGFGRQAVLLARAGHSVVIVDVDPRMVAMAEEQVSAEPPEVQTRVRIVSGAGEAAGELLPDAGFDLACCHSVLMYQHDPAPLLSSLVELVRRGGLLSILSNNPRASAMRPGLQGRWQDAVAMLRSGTAHDERSLPTHEHSLLEVVSLLEAAGARVVEWLGVGTFTDHLVDTLVVEDPSLVYEAEWLAGRRDPYRQIARCFHLIARRG